MRRSLDELWRPPTASRGSSPASLMALSLSTSRLLTVELLRSDGATERTSGDTKKTADGTEMTMSAERTQSLTELPLIFLHTSADDVDIVRSVNEPQRLTGEPLI